MIEVEKDNLKRLVLLCQQCYGNTLELSPARYQMIYELKKRGYKIYLFLPETVRNARIKSELFQATNTLNMSTKEIRNKIRKINPKYIIASTYEDTNILYPLPWLMRNTVFIYYNLEIYTPMEAGRRCKGRFWEIRYRLLYLENKIKEIAYTKSCKVFTIQDKLRKKTSQKYFIRHPNTLFIPNSYYYYKENIPKTKGEGIVYSGELNKLLLEQLMEGLATVPNLPITFSGWNDDWFIKKFKQLKQTHPDIKVYTAMLSPDQYTQFLCHFAVGLVWYTPIEDENINNIGMSSGKLFKHLSLGQPVIVNECPGMSRVVQKLGLGIVIQDVSNLIEAYNRIMEQYESYRNNVLKIYRNKFDFVKVVSPLLDQLDNF